MPKKPAASEPEGHHTPPEAAGPGPTSKGKRDPRADLAALEAAMVVAEAWRAKALARNLADLKSIIAHEVASPGGRPVVPGSAVAIAKVAPWEAGLSEATWPDFSTGGASVVAGGAHWAPEKLDLDDAGLEILLSQSPQAAHVDRARAWLGLLKGTCHLRPEEEPAPMLAYFNTVPRNEWFTLFEDDLILEREAELDERFWHGSDFPALREGVFEELEGWPVPWDFDAHALRRAAEDGGPGGPRFRAEAARAVRDTLAFLGVVAADEETVFAWDFWEGGKTLALSWGFLGLELRLTAEDVHAALLGANPPALPHLVPHLPIGAVVHIRREKEAFLLAIASALSAHGVLRGPCERCAYPAWLVPYRGPKARGPVPASHRLCATCEVLDHREKSLARVRKAQAKPKD